MYIKTYPDLSWCSLGYIICPSLEKGFLTAAFIFFSDASLLDVSSEVLGEAEDKKENRNVLYLV